MRPRVIADFMSFSELPAENVRVLRDAFAKHKEGELNMPLSCHLKQLRRVGRVRAIIKGHRDKGSIDVNFRERNFLSVRRIRRRRTRC